MAGLQARQQTALMAALTAKHDRCNPPPLGAARTALARPAQTPARRGGDTRRVTVPGGPRSTGELAAAVSWRQSCCCSGMARTRQRRPSVGRPRCRCACSSPGRWRIYAVVVPIAIPIAAAAAARGKITWRLPPWLPPWLLPPSRLSRASRLFTLSHPSRRVALSCDDLM